MSEPITHALLDLPELPRHYLGRIMLLQSALLRAPGFLRFKPCLASRREKPSALAIRPSTTHSQPDRPDQAQHSKACTTTRQARLVQETFQTERASISNLSLFFCPHTVSNLLGAAVSTLQKAYHHPPCHGRERCSPYTDAVIPVVSLSHRCSNRSPSLATVIATAC